MKSLSVLAIVLTFALHAHSQATMRLYNRTNCQLMVQTYSVSIGGCVYGSFMNNIMPAGSTTTVTAPFGDEWHYAEVTSFPYCTGGVSFAIGTPMNCNSTCTWGAPAAVVTTNNGCNGCLPTINAKWDDCQGPGTGILVIADF